MCGGRARDPSGVRHLARRRDRAPGPTAGPPSSATVQSEVSECGRCGSGIGAQAGRETGCRAGCTTARCRRVVHSHRTGMSGAGFQGSGALGDGDAAVDRLQIERSAAGFRWSRCMLRGPNLPWTVSGNSDSMLPLTVLPLTTALKLAGRVAWMLPLTVLSVHGPGPVGLAHRDVDRPVHGVGPHDPGRHHPDVAVHGGDGGVGPQAARR